jgi:hypothetical protein
MKFVVPDITILHQSKHGMADYADEAVDQMKGFSEDVYRTAAKYHVANVTRPVSRVVSSIFYSGSTSRLGLIRSKSCMHTTYMIVREYLLLLWSTGSNLISLIQSVQQR